MESEGNWPWVLSWRRDKGREQLYRFAGEKGIQVRGGDAAECIRTMDNV